MIVIPCNTVHIFIDELRRVSNAPILSVVEETSAGLCRNHVKRAGILGTSGTIASKLYEKSLTPLGIESVTPQDKDQKTVNDIVKRILEGAPACEDKDALIRIADTLLANGADVVLLACTDLQNLIGKEDLQGRIADTFDILVDSAFRAMVPAHLAGPAQ